MHRYMVMCLCAHMCNHEEKRTLIINYKFTNGVLSTSTFMGAQTYLQDIRNMISAGCPPLAGFLLCMARHMLVNQSLSSFQVSALEQRWVRVRQ